jgi:shikimate dehydrogenase
MTKRVGLIGWPVAQSISPAMHNAAFQALGLDWHYDAMAIPPDIVKYGIKEPMQHGYIGVNVTIPHKQEVMKIVKPDEYARAIGAVNTVDFRDLTGTNTDVTGFIDDLKAHNVPITGETVIVLGAGGASRAATYGLWREGANVIIVNRSLERANKMLADLAISAGILSRVDALTIDDASTLPASLIVNATPVGMYPNEDESPWVNGVSIPPNATLYDMIYRPAKTKLMTQVEANGGRAISGLGMLVRQGALSFQLWTGVEAPIDVMFSAARNALQIKEDDKS